MEKVGFGISAILGLSQTPQAGAKKYTQALLGQTGINGDILGSPDKKVLGPTVDQKPFNSNFTDTEII